MKLPVIITTCVILAFCDSICAQSSNRFNLQIGQRCPDFTFRNISHYKASSASLKQFKGKWLIIDFWDPTCLACIKGFKKINALQQEFKDQATFMLVGPDDSVSRTVYEKFRKKYELRLPVSFDSDLSAAFNVTSVPHLVVIDTEGLLKSVTYAAELTSQSLRGLINGNAAALISKQERDDSGFDLFKPFLINDNGGPDTTFLYRSLLMKWNKSLPSMGFSYIDAKMYGNMVQISGRPVEALYYFAYMDTLYPFPTPYYEETRDNYGEYWMSPVIEVSDSSKLTWKIGSEKNIYCYSLIVPKEKATTRHLKQTMQKDLTNYFGYVAEVQTRVMPCWYLTATDQARTKLRTNGIDSVYKDNGYAGFEFRDVPVKEIIVRLYRAQQLGPPFIDATGINGNIDITIDADLSDINEFKSALKKQGLELVYGKKEMKVVVIKDN